MIATKDARTAIHALDEVFMERIAAKDAGALAEAWYAEDAELLPPNQPLISGRQGIASYWQGLLDAGLNDVVLNTQRIDISGDLAYAVGQYALTIKPTEGEASYDKGKYLVTYRRQADGSWKVVADMFGSDQGAG